MMSDTVRVFVDARGVDVPRGAVPLDAVRAHDAQLADDVVAGRRVITDSRGLPADMAVPAAAGAIFRVVMVRDRAIPGEDA
jgi:hypothetical protein